MDTGVSSYLDASREARPDVVEGPGDVTISYRPAGLGSRFLAALIDHLMLISLLLMISIFLSLFMMSEFLVSSLLILYVLYFVLLEGRTGRTVGKSALGLRVIMDDGRPPTPRAALVRNILRIADLFPRGVPGVAIMTYDRAGRRIGDLVAGTVVVREGRMRLSENLLLRIPYRERPQHPEAVLHAVRLTPAEYQALRTFCFRTRTLTPARRQALARRLLAPLHARAGIPMPHDHSCEDLLVDLLHHENGTFGETPPGVTGRGPAGTQPPGLRIRNVRRRRPVRGEPVR